ncbi:alpha/beta hydrolase [Aspergillus vadensis CBS 113365]|uniref:Alpha/beta-hydrolase n=1 Tax=Aspergillus vadensis (strain CBS 113365 / IMI 142717 / IBT 24658) TaxID=1448311 RepID=A0A319B1K2_ASPVC|nr:alpha/beta-hydrolase [Aspergillus vadensis CBS 113365]PYH66329.1 alpha/beta-hydrolase [Aspergillus vadensis CBS 113365]
MAWYSQTIESFSDSLGTSRSQLPLLAVTGASFTLGLLFRSLLSDPQLESTVLESPRKKVLSVSDSVNRELPLPTDVLPGARDVSTPYGSIRVYEWGPEDGPKVLLVHGITTPCIALGGLAHALVDRGCRVMLFDLFGRGYSDCPSDIPQDNRLFATQILLALSSSSLSWTGAGSGRFCLVGYSLGGGIAASFAAYFPQFLSSLVLLAPAGLIRDSQISFQSRLLYSRGLVPERVLGFLVGRRLRAGPLTTPKPKARKLTAEDALAEELPTQGAAQVQQLSRTYSHVNVPSAVQWQVGEHAGFVHAFMSSMRHGPILQQRQRETWERLGSYLSAQKDLPIDEQRLNGLPSDKVLIMCGDHDAVIVKNELVPDATSALQGHASFKFFNAGHEFPSTKYEEVAQYVMEFMH